MVINNRRNFIWAKIEDISNHVATIRGKENNLGTLLEIKEGEIVVLVLNIGNNIIKLKENQNISKIEAVEEATIGPNLSKPNHNHSVELLNVNFEVQKKIH